MPRKPAPENVTDISEASSFNRLLAVSRDDLRKAMQSGRSYVWPPNAAEDEAQLFVSVTSVLNNLPKPALTRWAAKVVAEHAVENFDTLEGMIGKGDEDGATRWLKGAPWATRDRAGFIGTELHRIAELIVEDNHSEAASIAAALPTEGARRKAEQLIHFFATVPVYVDVVEGVVYNMTHGYAGTFDFIFDTTKLQAEGVARWPGEMPTKLMTDLKTSKGIYDETALQLAAYANAEFLVELATAELKPMPEVGGGAVLHVTEDGWTLTPAHIGPDTFQKFIDILRLSGHLPLKGLLGTPILRGSTRG